MTTGKRLTADEAVEAWFDEVTPALTDGPGLKAAHPAPPVSQHTEALSSQPGRASEQEVERWFDEVAGGRPAVEPVPEIPAAAPTLESEGAMSRPTRSPIAERRPEKVAEELVDRSFGGVDEGFELRKVPTSEVTSQAPAAEVPRASQPPAVQPAQIETAAQVVAEPRPAPDLRGASVETYIEPTFSLAADDPALTVAQCCGKLEKFSTELRRIGPRLRRADLLLRSLDRRETPQTS